MDRRRRCRAILSCQSELRYSPGRISIARGRGGSRSAPASLRPPVGCVMPAHNGLLQVFVETRSALSRFLVTRGATPDEADEILQELHLKLLTENIGPVAQPRAYLYRMTSNHFAGARRSARRRVRREEEWTELRGGGDGEIDEAPSVETVLIAREQLAILQRVLDGLPERTRSIFRRFRVDLEPQRRIADDLGISVSAVEKHLSRAYTEIAAAKLLLDEDATERRHLSDEGSRYER